MTTYRAKIGGLAMHIEVTAPQYDDEVNVLLGRFSQEEGLRPELAHELCLTVSRGEPFIPMTPDSTSGLPSLTYHPASGVYRTMGDYYGLQIQSSPARTSLHIEDRGLGGLAYKSVTRAALRYGIAIGASHHDGVLIHGCAMVPPGGESAYLFVGQSGAGKTTMRSRLAGWTALGDDTVLVRLRPSDGQLVVAGTPIPGKEGLPQLGLERPLGPVLFLEPKAADLSVAPLTPTESFPRVMGQTFCAFKSGPLITSVLDTVMQIALSSPSYVLSSSLHHDVAPSLLSKAGMTA